MFHGGAEYSTNNVKYSTERVKGSNEAPNIPGEGSNGSLRC